MVPDSQGSTIRSTTAFIDIGDESLIQYAHIIAVQTYKQGDKMSKINWVGARWWKFDFHAHTPSSCDYGKGTHQTSSKQITAKDWLLGFMKAEIDCVAVTDHNSGDHIDILKQALSKLKAEQPKDYRELYLFPGIEISVSGGIHLLAIFGQKTTTSDINKLIGAVGYKGQNGYCEHATTKTMIEVIREIEKAGGIPIPAHSDKDAGLFSMKGPDASNIQDKLYAMEVVDRKKDIPKIFYEANKKPTIVIGSDSHHPDSSQHSNYPGSHYTWVKMGTPCIEGLRLALLDGEMSVKRFDEVSTDSDLNHHTGAYIERIEIERAQYIGNNKAFVLSFNPCMNAIIGGRGTGKSTIVELIRVALRRDNELDELPEEMKSDFLKYRRSKDDYESGLLRNDSVVRVYYRKGQVLYRVQWNVQGTLDPIEEEQSDGTWKKSEGDVASRFPASIYSQKQIFQIAGVPSALIKKIDEASQRFRELEEERVAAERNYLTTRAKIRELTASIDEITRLKGDLDDIQKKIKVFEQHGHSELLKEYQRCRRQVGAFESWESRLTDIVSKLRKTGNEVLPDTLDRSSFDLGRVEESELLSRLEKTAEVFEEISLNISKLASSAEAAAEKWLQDRLASEWQRNVKNTETAHFNLIEQLKIKGVSDPSEYGFLIQKHQAIEKQIKEKEANKIIIADLEAKSEQILSNIFYMRNNLTEMRRKTVEDICKNNKFVRIEIKLFGNKQESERNFSTLIGREQDRFAKDIDSLFNNLYEGNPDRTEMEMKLKRFKDTIREYAKNGQNTTAKDLRFANYLSKLSPEVLDRLAFWYPEDSIAVSFLSSNGKYNPISDGSPGQKTATLLAFFLSYDDSPLILDQPEDDLDNRLIYDLIVEQLRRIKPNRQVIVVTHNANIVVNGDAELVVALDAKQGQTEQSVADCLQVEKVRKTICDIMEGGEIAFKQRYDRIALEGRNVR